MRYLLDSHALLWYTLGNPNLSQVAEALIVDKNNDILISPASYWEIAIKVSLGKLALHQPYDDFMEACLGTYSFTILPIAPRHAAAVVTLPHHHRDPFDRLLAGQAIVEQIPLISNDSAFDAYEVTRVW